MGPLLIWLLILPGTFLVLPLLSVVTGWVCARRLPSVSRVFGLLTGCACGIVVGYLMLYRYEAWLWWQGQFGVNMPHLVFYWILTVALAAAGIGATWGMCRLRRAAM